MLTSAHSRDTDIKTLVCSQMLTVEPQKCASFCEVLLAMVINFLWLPHLCNDQEGIVARKHLLKQESSTKTQLVEILEEYLKVKVSDIILFSHINL